MSKFNNPTIEQLIEMEKLGSKLIGEELFKKTFTYVQIQREKKRLEK